MTLLQHHILALTLTAITTFGLGLLVFLADPKRRLNQIFGLYSLAISWWACFEALFCINCRDILSANFYSRLEWSGIFFIAPTFLHTVFLLIEERKRWAKQILVIAYASSSLFFILHVCFGRIIASLRPVAYLPLFSMLTLVGLLVPVAFFVFVNLGLFKLGCAYRNATGRRRIQLKYLFWGSLIGYVGGSPNWFLVFGFHIPGLNPFGIYGVPLYSIATTYAVLHHKLFDVHVVIRKSLVYSLLVTTLTVGYFSLVHAVEKGFQTTFGYHSVGLSLAAFALMALAFQPLKVGIQRLVDWLIFRVPQEELVRRVERLEVEVQQAEKLKAVSSLAAGLAHEIKNPLTSIKTFTEHLEEHYDDPAFRGKFKKIVGGEIERINLIVQQLLEFAKPVPPKLTPVEVPRLLDETLELLNSELVQRHVEVTRCYAASPRVLADPQQLKQVFLNLVLNSLQAMNGTPPREDGGGRNPERARQGESKDGAGRLEIQISANGSELVVTIADNGAGIAPKDLPHIFEPFFTTKAAGTGLGLAVVHGIIKEHGGRIEVDSRPSEGTRMTLHLPVAV